MKRHVTVAKGRGLAKAASKRTTHALAKRGEFKIVRHGDVRRVSRHATGEVIETYGEALSKLAKH